MVAVMTLLGYRKDNSLPVFIDVLFLSVPYSSVYACHAYFLFVASVKLAFPSTGSLEDDKADADPGGAMSISYVYYRRSLYEAFQLNQHRRTAVKNTPYCCSGDELQDGSLPSPDHDIFVLTRPSSAPAGCCLPKPTTVTFREPGKKTFQLELPLDSPLKNIKATLLSTMESSRQERNGSGAAKEEVARADERDSRDCTLLVGGKKMSNSYLLGDYLLMRNTMRRTPTVLVLWHPLRQEPTKATCAAAAAATSPPRVGLPPVSAFAAAASLPLLIELQEEGRGGRQPRSRRSVKRRCKGVTRFSGQKRGARCGLGIKPLRSQ